MKQNSAVTRREALRRFAGVAVAATLPAFLRPFSALAQQKEAQPRPSSAEQAAMAGIAGQFMAKYHVPGMSVAFARHGEFVYGEGFGVADQGSGEKVTPASRFRIASVTKPITSATLFTLMEQGRLHLGDRVFGLGGLLGFKYADSYSPQVEDITIEHLLTHTCGGWSNDNNDPMFHDPKMPVIELIGWTLHKFPLQHVPGSHYAYSNFGYCLLGRVIEELTNQPYAAAARQQVLDRCGIRGMIIAGNTPGQRAPKEVVYYGGNENPYDMNIRRMDSHGGWLATANQLVKFALHVDGLGYVPNILQPDSIRAMTTPSSANPGYAKGWCINSAPNWWHTGSLPGTTTLLVRTASGLCWSALTNTRTDGIDLALDDMMWRMASAVPAWKV